MNNFFLLGNCIGFDVMIEIVLKCINGYEIVIEFVSNFCLGIFINQLNYIYEKFICFEQYRFLCKINNNMKIFVFRMGSF